MFVRYAPLIRVSLKYPFLIPLILKLKREKKTYLTYATLPCLGENVNQVFRYFQQPLHIAEFGVGRGGSATLLAWLINKHKGRLTLFDVFERIPPPTEKDGQRALDRYEVIVSGETSNYYGNIENLLALIKNEIKQVCDLEHIEFVQGRYEETLITSGERKAFHFAHVDCDWYESSKVVLSYLEPRLIPGGIVQIDDYSNWQGSKNAFEEACWLHPYQKRIVDGALIIDTSKRE